MKPTEHSMNSTLTLEEKLIQANHYYIDKARRLYPSLEISYPVIKTTLKGKASGMAYFSLWQVNYNMEILKNNEKEFLVQTVGHEIAHLVAHKILGSLGHDKGWKMIMRLFGLEPKRCHNYNMEGVTVKTRKTVSYSCGCPEKTHEIGIVRHKNILKGSIFQCCKCKTNIKAV